ncbi:MAG: hypothetical protein R3D84_05765 [Paracoccaceae bacterium]
MTEWDKIFADKSCPNHSDSYVEMDEFADVLSSLVTLREALRTVEVTPTSWKWIILAAHSALQGSCVCLLTRTDGSGALTEKAEMALRHYHDHSTQKAITEGHGGRWILPAPACPDDRVANLPDLLRRLPTGLQIDSPKNGANPEMQPNLDIWRLHDFRNRFTHFPSLHWSIEIAGLPRIIEEALALTRRITESSEYTQYNRFSEMDLEPIFTEIFNSLKNLKT